MQLIHPWLDPAVWLTTTLSIWSGSSADTNKKDVDSVPVCFLKRTQEAQKKSKSQICIFPFGLANLRFAFLQWLLNLPQESQGVTIGKRLTDKKVEELPASGQYEARSAIQESTQYSLYLQHNQYFYLVYINIKYIIIY